MAWPMPLSFERVVAELRLKVAPASDKPDETPEATAAALWLAAAGAPVGLSGVERALPELTIDQCEALQGLVERRTRGEPLAYLTGLQEFLGLSFIAAPGALIPRRETELLGEAARSVLRELAVTRNGTLPVLDLCTGCGNLAIALALAVPQAQVVATDLEAAALAVAARNVERFGLDERVRLLQGDLFGALSALDNPGASGATRTGPPFALICCNPPYLTTRHATHMPVAVGGSEPVAAFDGGPFGLSIILRLVREAPAYLEAGGWLCFEIGAGQETLVESRVAQNQGYVAVRRTLDAQGVVRALQVAWDPGVKGA